MSKKQKKMVLGRALVKHNSRVNIPVTFVDDDRSPKEIQDIQRATWRKNKIWNRPEGFSLIPDGRVISICFRRGDKLIDFAAEIAGSPVIDVVIFDDLPEKWIDVKTLECEPVSATDQAEVRAALIDWLTKRGIKFSLGGVIVTKL